MTGMTTSTSPGIAQRTASFASGAPKNGLLKKKAQEVAAAGRGGDTELAHVNPREKAMLKRAGGSGSHNPKTGLREFMDEGGGGTGDGSGANASAGGEADAPGDRDVGTAATAPQGGWLDALNATKESINSPDFDAAVAAWNQPANKEMNSVFSGAMGMMSSGFGIGKAAAGWAMDNGVAMDMPGKSPRGAGGDDAGQGDPGTGTVGPVVSNYTGTHADAPNGLAVQAQGSPNPSTHPNGSYQVNPDTGQVEWTPET